MDFHGKWRLRGGCLAVVEKCDGKFWLGLVAADGEILPYSWDLEGNSATGNEHLDLFAAERPALVKEHEWRKFELRQGESRSALPDSGKPV